MRLNIAFGLGVMLLMLRFSSASISSGYKAHIEDTSLRNKVLSGHSFKNFTRATFHDCFFHCGQTCRCRSFNLKIGNGERAICELNDADKEEAPYALREKIGFIHVSFQPLEKKCAQNAAQNCCSENVCQNGGTCVANVRSGKSGFTCMCKEGNTGKVCENNASSCEDYLRHNSSTSSGLYKIQLGEQGETKTVFCHFNNTNWEAWTLVLSYSFSNKDIFKVLVLNKDHPFNEDNIVFDKYRASLGLMTYFKKKSSFWRATCNYDTKVNGDDFVQSSFATLDIMENGVINGGHHCAKIDVLKIYGQTYRQMGTWIIRDPAKTFYLSPDYGMSHNCELSVPYYDRGMFGWYSAAAPNHGCAASAESTTQYWFGIRL